MNKLIKNFLSVSVSNLLGQLLTFIIVIYYSGIIGKTNFGKITLAQQILLYFTMIVLFGIQTYGTRIVSADRENAYKKAGEIITFRLVISLICFAIICLSTIVINKDVNFKVIFIIFGLTLIPTALNIDWIFNGLQEMQHNAIYNLCKNIIPCIIIFIFLKSENNMYLIPFAILIGVSIGVIYQYIVFFIIDKGKLEIKMNKEIILKYSRYGMPFLLSGFFGMINNNVDKIIMGFTRTEGELGVYQSAYIFISFLINVAAIILTPVFPLFIKYFYEDKKEELKRLCDGTTKLVAFIVVPIFVGGTILAKDIILLFKKEYFQAYEPLRILMFYILILFIREIYGYQLNAWKLEKKYLKIIILSSVGNLILNLILTPKYGMVAAAWITTLTELINLILMRSCANKIVRTKDIAYIGKAFIPSFIMALGILGLKWLNINVVIIILISIFIYGVFAVITKGIAIGEIKALFAKREGI